MPARTARVRIEYVNKLVTNTRAECVTDRSAASSYSLEVLITKLSVGAGRMITGRTGDGMTLKRRYNQTAFTMHGLNNHTIVGSG